MQNVAVRSLLSLRIGLLELIHFDTILKVVMDITLSSLMTLLDLSCTNVIECSSRVLASPVQTRPGGRYQGKPLEGPRDEGQPARSLGDSLIRLDGFDPDTEFPEGIRRKVESSDVKNAAVRSMQFRPTNAST